MYATKDNTQTEDKDACIVDPCNIERVLEEVVNCSIVILCGSKAALLAPHLSGKALITMAHPGNKGLRNAYANTHPLVRGIRIAADRDKLRKRLYAHEIIKQMGSA